MDIDQFGKVESVNITILVDNQANLIVESNDWIKYFTDKALLAEHGFSALVDFPGSDHKILWDAGVTKIALMENLRRMEIDVKAIDMIALSHGHHDHFAALTETLAAMKLGVESREWDGPVTSAKVAEWAAAKHVPVIAHPAAFRERWWVKDDGTMVGPFTPPPRLEWEALGGTLVLSGEPYKLLQGCWTTGFVPRMSFEQSGRPTKLLYRQGDNFIPDDLEEDQAIVIHVKEKGLVILSGCAHAGIVNTVNHARQISGVDQVYAIIGGFHLARANAEEIQQTIDFIQVLNPEIILPCHCTGFQAMCAFSRQMPDTFVPGVVGATCLF